MSFPDPIRVAPSRDFAVGVRSRLQLAGETIAALRGPGDTLNMFGSYDYATFRDAGDRRARLEGVHRVGKDGIAVADVANPDAPDGRWDPYAWLPRFVFHRDEDAFPVSPAFDRDDRLGDNVSAYRDGVLGGRQDLRASFHVTRKGGYTVLTYGLYMAHNKAGKYHPNDYAAAQIYLAPGKDGKLAPKYVFATWHRGGVLVPWEDLAKDAAGRPVLKVGLGTHALQAVGRGERWEEDGLVLDGQGRARFAGRDLGQRLRFEAFQGNVAGAMPLLRGTPEFAARAKVLGWGGGSLDPYMPASFEGRGFWHELAGKAKAAVKAAWSKLESLL